MKQLSIEEKQKIKEALSKPMRVSGGNKIPKGIWMILLGIVLVGVAVVAFAFTISVGAFSGKGIQCILFEIGAFGAGV